MKPLCELFPQLYHLFEKRLHLVVSLFISFDPSPLLSSGFHRPLTNCESLEVVGLLSIISYQRVSFGRRDLWVWEPKRVGFSCPLFFLILCSLSPSGGASVFSSSLKFLVWQILHGRVNTLDHIYQHSTLVLCPQQFIFCKQWEEDQGYLLQGCHFPCSLS